MRFSEMFGPLSSRKFPELSEFVRMWGLHRCPLVFDFAKTSDLQKWDDTKIVLKCVSKLFGFSGEAFAISLLKNFSITEKYRRFENSGS